MAFQPRQKFLERSRLQFKLPAGFRENVTEALREALAHSALAAFGHLTPEQRSLLLWVTVEGLSYREVADILDVPIGTVMSRLSRARQAMRRYGDGELPTPSLRLLK